MDLFETQTTTEQGIPKTDLNAPLAVRMRPTALEEVVGQDHLLTPGSPLRRLIEAPASNKGVNSVILWGPPGTGKTTLAYLVASSAQRNFVEISAVSAGVKEVRSVIKAAKTELVSSGQQTVLFIDEVHRFSKTQQDALLPAVENRWVVLIAATTENPAFSVVSPLLSRSLLLTLHPLDKAQIEQLLQRALEAKTGLGGDFEADEGVLEAIAQLAGPDARRALTLLEAAAACCRDEDRTRISSEDVRSAADAAIVRYDQDDHYDVISAFIKSMRGSDVDGALHYLARMLEGGEDPRFIARRLMICASEDVGMADSSILPLCVSAAQAVQLVGMPEARIILAHATVALATAPKSNAAYLGIEKALADVKRGSFGEVPFHLRDSHYASAKDLGVHGYKYAHNYPYHIVSQTYLPANLVGRQYYEPSEIGQEKLISHRLKTIRQILANVKQADS